MQQFYLQAAIATLPPTVRELLQLVADYQLKGWQRQLVKASGALADRIPLHSAPPAQTCKRLGLPAYYLYK